MRKLLRELQESLKDFLSSPLIELDDRRIDRFKLMFGAQIAVSAIILQAFIATGVSDAYAFFSVVFLAIALPFLGLFMFIISITEYFKKTTAPLVLSLVYYAGPFACGSGTAFAFFHISPIAGYVFIISFTVCALIFLSFKISRHGIDD